MIALEGQKFVKLDKILKEDIKENTENILFLLFHPNDDEESISAFDVSGVLSAFGDVYVVKDSDRSCFAEF